jgi:hypothetical protein
MFLTTFGEDEPEERQPIAADPTSSNRGIDSSLRLSISMPLDLNQFRDFSEYLTGDDVLNLNRTNMMLTRDVKKNELCKQMIKQLDTWLYHHLKNVEYFNRELKEHFITSMPPYVS